MPNKSANSTLCDAFRPGSILSLSPQPRCDPYIFSARLNTIRRGGRHIKIAISINCKQINVESDEQSQYSIKDESIFHIFGTLF